MNNQHPQDLGFRPSSCSHIFLRSHHHSDLALSHLLLALAPTAAVIHHEQDYYAYCDRVAKQILPEWQQTAVQTQLVIWQIDCLAPEHVSGICTPSVAGLSLAIAQVKRLTARLQYHVIHACKWIDRWCHMLSICVNRREYV